MTGAAALSGASAFGSRAAASRAAAKHWAWQGDADWTLDAWKGHFARMRAAGISAVLLHQRIQHLEALIPAARDEGLDVHLWMITMMQGGMEEEHPEWYAVNREGVSTAQDPPYVDYYKFLCPSRRPVQEHLKRQADALAQIDGITSVHLDYIRYPDVILPVALWPKYDLAQDQEYPTFDYCYCAVCRETFQQQTGLDPLDLDDPAAHDAWLQYRYDSITHVVNQLAEVVHARGKLLTAAVFPTPAIARKLVRQDWVHWNLDAVLPMIYNWFYEEDVAWVETATREGVEALAGAFPLYSGLYVPELTPDELAEAARRALAGGAAGIVVFEGKTPTEAHWRKLAEVIQA